MELQGMRLTNAGLNLLARSLNGAQIVFTRGAFGDAILNDEMQAPSTDEQAALTALIHEKMSLAITSIAVEGNMATVALDCDNSAVTAEFKIAEIGLFAQDGSNEILYSYYYAGENADVMPKNGGAIVKDFTCEIITVVSNAALVTAIIQKNIDLPTASSLTAGVVKVGSGLAMDGDTLNVTLTAGESYTLPVATAARLGGIKVGNGMSIDSGGKLDVTLSAEKYTLPAATANSLGGIKVGNGMSIDSAGKLDVTLTAGESYTLPVATADSLGGIKVGNGMSIDSGGKLDVTLTSEGNGYFKNFTGDDFTAYDSKGIIDELRWKEESFDLGVDEYFESKWGRAPAVGDIALLYAPGNETIYILRTSDKWVNLGTWGWQSINPLLTTKDRAKLDSITGGNPFSEKVTMNGGFQVADSKKVDFGNHVSIDADNASIDVRHASIDAGWACIDANNASVAGVVEFNGDVFFNYDVAIDGNFTVTPGAMIAINNNTIRANNSSVAATAASLSAASLRGDLSKASISATAASLSAESLTADLDKASISAVDSSINAEGADVNFYFATVNGTSSDILLSMAQVHGLGNWVTLQGSHLNFINTSDITVDYNSQIDIHRSTIDASAVTIEGGYKPTVIKAERDSISCYCSTIDANSADIRFSNNTTVKCSGATFSEHPYFTDGIRLPDNPTVQNHTGLFWYVSGDPPKLRLRIDNNTYEVALTQV